MGAGGHLGLVVAHHSTLGGSLDAASYLRNDFPPLR